MSKDNPDDPELVTALTTVTLPGRVRAEISRAVSRTKSFESALPVVSNLSSSRARTLLNRCRELGVKAVHLTSSEYPSMLKAIDAPPLVLFVRGCSLVRVRNAVVAVVGARSASVSTCQRTSSLCFELARGGATIVSGLALGVDGAAHRGALGAPGETTTIAVLAHGLDILYPASHQTLAQSIIDRGGALVSEYPPGTPVHKHNFLERNRIIAGLSRCVVVAEAGARSGSLVTAHYAADYGRDVFVLASEEGRAPGEGGRHLLEEGARLVGSAGEILAEYGLIAERDPEDDVWITVDESELLEKPGVGPADLLELELGGDLVRLGSGHIMVRSSRGRVNQRT